MNPTNPSEIAAAYNDWAATYDAVENRTRDLAGEVLRQVFLGARAPSPAINAQRGIETPAVLGARAPSPAMNAQREIETPAELGARAPSPAINAQRGIETPDLGNRKLAGRTIIEIGCGTGRNTEWLARSGAREIIGLDFSAAMLARARARIPEGQVRFVQHDIRERWPLGNESAGLVIVLLVLEHVANLQTIFAEAARVLKIEGELFICELHPMRQLLGGQARFTNAQTGEQQLVPAFLHNVSDFVNDGLSAGFELKHLGEWRDEDASVQDLPRLLSLTFRLPAPE